MTGAPDELLGFSNAVQAARSVLATIDETLALLQTLLLTGRPPDIADMALRLDIALTAAQPILDKIHDHLASMKMLNLAELSLALLQRGESDLARGIRDVELRLKAIMTHSLSGYRCADGLARSLTASLAQLRAAGAIDPPGLLAEA
jgi:hypothetical protein